MVNKKHTIEFIHEEFAKEGYTLLTKSYKNNYTKLNYICPNGHNHFITWGHWNTSGARCPYCSGNIKYTYEEVKDVFNSLNYKLLSKEYKTAKHKLSYICDHGHINKSSFYSINNGHICPDCVGNKKLTVGFVRGQFLKEGYVLLTKKYINNKQKLTCVCPAGHEFKIRFDSWITGRRCPICKGINLSINRSGSGHPNWKGGISCEPYCQDWTKEYKEFIKERDGHKCLNPVCKKTDKLLSIHHIDYNKKNCNLNNLITLCRACNSIANHDRDWHQSWYQAIINKRYKMEQNNNDRYKNRKIT